MINDKRTERLKRLFPDYFERFDLPEGAKPEKIEVYRACKTQKCDKESFTPSFEEKGFKYLQGDNPRDPSLYSLSTAEKPKDIKRFVNLNSEYKKPYKIAKGVTSEECGFVQRTKERIPSRRNSHVDWWLFKNAEPYKFFEIISDFDKYIQDYKKDKV